METEHNEDLNLSNIPWSKLKLDQSFQVSVHNCPARRVHVCSDEIVLCADKYTLFAYDMDDGKLRCSVTMSDII